MPNVETICGIFCSVFQRCNCAAWCALFIMLARKHKIGSGVELSWSMKLQVAREPIIMRSFSACPNAKMETSAPRKTSTQCRSTSVQHSFFSLNCLNIVAMIEPSMLLDCPDHQELDGHEAIVKKHCSIHHVAFSHLVFQTDCISHYHDLCLRVFCVFFELSLRDDQHDIESKYIG